ncbi:MAG: transcriptional regulator with XRE-family HTH domain [Chitinophagales bacterium]|jgi:transcriptional regulator with XRE-family HTH domain
MSIFGKNIKTLRQSNGLSQQEFANLFELSRASIGSYEEGRADPKIDTLIKIAKYFKVKIDQLVIGRIKEEPLPITAPQEEKVEEKGSSVYLEDRMSLLESRLSEIEERLKNEG